MLAPLPPHLDSPGDVHYVYEGLCPVSGHRLTLPRTTRSERLVSELGATLPPLSEGKMIGVLVVATRDGRGVLKAFSGLWDGSATREGWVPPIGGEPPPSTPATLQRLDALKAQLVDLLARDDLARLTDLERQWDENQARMEARLREARAARHARRDAGENEDDLRNESRHDSRERRLFRQARTEALAALREQAARLEAQILEIKRERRRLSRTLQAEMHADLARTLSHDQPWSLASLFPKGLPTGTGDCCAPKLLYHAALRGWEPLEMAEIWWGAASVNGQRQPGVCYGACENRCQPLLGPLLSRRALPIDVQLEDDRLVAVVKPPGLLTVPGREHWKHDSLQTRLQRLYPEARAVHRLDLETSGLVVFARDREALAHLHAQLAARTVTKTYHALLDRTPASPQGVVDMALGPDPHRPGCYRPDPQGRPSRTIFRMLDPTRVELEPHTGRSHQLRIHMASGLGCPIRGDALYGSPGPQHARLLLHATALRFRHPDDERPVHLEAPPGW